MGTAANTLPFAPLTDKGLTDLREEAAQSAANNLIYHLRYASGSLEDDVMHALPHAVLYGDLLDAAMTRFRGEGRIR